MPNVIPQRAYEAYTEFDFTVRDRHNKWAVWGTEDCLFTQVVNRPNAPIYKAQPFARLCADRGDTEFAALLLAAIDRCADKIALFS